MTRLFFAVPDYYPPWRLDVDELFAQQMPKFGMVVTWSMRRDIAGPCILTEHRGQSVYLPLKFPVNGVVGKIINKLTQYACEVVLFSHLLFGPHFDIIQVRDRRYLFAFFGWLVARAQGAKFIYWSSYPFPEHLMEMGLAKQGVARAFYWLYGQLSWFYVYRFIMLVADHVFVQSEQMLRNVSGYGVPAEKMTSVSMGVPPRILDWAKFHTKKNVRRGEVVYVGTLARVRRMGVIIEAFSLVRKCNSNVHLIMVGQGDTPDEQLELEVLVSQLGLTHDVTFTGFMPMEKAWDRVARAEVCLSPIYPTPVLDVGSPTKLIEFMALGRPVVASKHPEQTAILSESGAGLCVSWGAESFAKAILELLRNPEIANRMGACGPPWVEANRTYDKLAAEVYVRYRILLGEKF